MPRKLGFAAAAIAVAAWTLLRIAPDPLLVNKAGFSQAVYARDGRLLRLTLSSDEKYRLWVPLAAMPRSIVDATLVQEDAWFWRHPGVNPFSLVRALLTTYVSHSRRVGGSTITMQLARMRFGIDSRSLGGKLEQIVRALQIERRHSKREILEAYLNLVPYGGNVEGVGAASLVYFGKEPARLTVPEALTLAVIPQSPAVRTPAGATAATRLAEARSRLFARWLATHPASELSGAALAVTTAARHDLPFLAPHFVDEILKADDRSPRIATTLDLELQSLAEREVERFVERNRKLGIENATAILADYRSMEIEAYVGSADHTSDAIAGQVNGLRGRRSPGSALKPFIYALAIDQGLIHPQSILKDTSLRIADYNPENFDRDFVGPIDATSALVRSRNVPAIGLTNRLASPGLYGFLQQAGIRPLREESFYGLALALGGVELTMEEVTGLYAMLANGGVERRFRMRADEASPPPARLLSPEASFAVVDMLRSNPRPSEDSATPPVARRIAVPWKTGTSYGFRDAWAIGIVGRYVLGVWVGNFDGRPNANFVGRDAAGPLFFSIVDALRARGPLVESTVHDGLDLRKVKVCALSGDLPGPYCTHTKETWFIPGKSPIRTCSVHREVRIDVATGFRACPGASDETTTEVYEFWSSDLLKLFRAAGVPRRSPPPLAPACRTVVADGAAPLISSPAHGIEYGVHREDRSQIPFTAVTDADSRRVYWFVDAKLVGTSRSGETFLWPARPGRFLVRAVDDQGRAAAADLRVAAYPN